jgi:dTDP-4-amino-4,6-dideoxygalactose transaminase
LGDLGGVKVPQVPADCQHVFHQYTIRAEGRDELQKFLTGRKIGNAVYYPVPLHLQPIYAGLGHGAGSFPESEKAAAEAISLPMFPELRGEQIERVATAVAEFYGK